MIKIKIKSSYPINSDVLRQAALKVLVENKVQDDIELGISIVSNRMTHSLNKKYRGKDYPANILTFALGDEDDSKLRVPFSKYFQPSDKTLLGDIIISYPQALVDASTEGNTIDQEMAFLVEHGTKHLLGKHHD